MKLPVMLSVKVYGIVLNDNGNESDLYLAAWITKCLRKLMS